MGFVAQGLSNTAWALATLHVRDAPLLESISASSIAILSPTAVLPPAAHNFDSQALGNSAWSFSHLMYWHHEPLIHSLAASAIPLGDQLHIQSAAAMSDVYCSSGGGDARRDSCARLVVGRLRGDIVRFASALTAQTCGWMQCRTRGWHMKTHADLVWLRVLGG